MFIRFQGAILLAALVALAGSAMERSILDHRRALARQHYRLEALRERTARARLRTESLIKPAALDRPIEEGRLSVAPSSAGMVVKPAPPLLRWRAASEGRR